MEENLKIPAHVALILDGNGRWAKKRGLPRQLGHKKGCETPVSYTHLTLPTKRIVEISVVAGSLKKQNTKNKKTTEHTAPR